MTIVQRALRNHSEGDHGKYKDLIWSENVILMCGEQAVLSRGSHKDVHLETLYNAIFGFLFLSEV